MAEIVTRLTIRLPFWWRPYVHLVAFVARAGLCNRDAAFRHIERVADEMVKRHAVFVNAIEK